MRHNLQRPVLALVLILLPLRAQALDLAPDPSRVLSDPSYLPLGGQLFASTEFTFNETHSNTSNYLAAPQSSNNTDTTSLNQLLEFGVTDDLSFRVSGAYQVQGATNNYASGASTVTTSNGFIDPTFAGVWRFLDQKNNLFSWDLIGTYAPDLISAASASTDEFGSVARGGSTASAGTALSYKTKAFTVHGEFNAIYMDSRDILNQTNNVTTSYDPSWQYVAYLTTQTRFADPLSFNAGVSQTYSDNVNASFVSTSGKQFDYTTRIGNVTTVITSLNYQVTPDRFVASFIYTHVFYGDSATGFAGFPKSDTTTNGKESDVFGAMVRYVFN